MAKKETALATNDVNSAMVTGMADPVRKATPADLQSLKERGASFERVIKLAEDGDMIEGVYLGPGVPCETEDQVTKQTKPLPTWRIQLDGGGVARLLGGYQIDRELPALGEGKRVVIVRVGEEQTRKGNRVTSFAISEVRA